MIAWERKALFSFMPLNYIDIEAHSHALSSLGDIVAFLYSRKQHLCFSVLAIAQHCKHITPCCYFNMVVDH